MKHFVLISVLVLSVCTISTMDKKCLLPSAEILRNRLLTIPECQHFVNNSQIVPMFANQERFPVVVFMSLGNEIDNYAYQFKKKININPSIHIIEAMKPKIVELILQDYPFAVARLKEKGIMTESVN